MDRTGWYDNVASVGGSRRVKRRGRSMTCAERVVVVTSAALGMGRVIAQRFVQQGARVALCDQNVTGLAETGASIQRQGEKG